MSGSSYLFDVNALVGLIWDRHALHARARAWFIERRLRAELPVLRPAQFLSLAKLAEEARHATFHEEIRKLTPPRIWRATSALNGTFALFLDDLYGGATRYWGDYAALEVAPLAQKLWAHWSERTGDTLVAGDEYQLVDEFAEILGLQDWFSWKPDLGADDAVPAEGTPTPIVEGSTNPELLREKHPAAVWFLLDALKRFAVMKPDQVRPIVFEIAMLGREGLDYASCDQKYKLRALRELHARACKEQGTTGDWISFLAQTDRTLGRLRFRTILADVPESALGLQATLAMHLAPGYREFFRAWISLSATLEIGGGPLQLRERDVATLYEMWCFVALARLLRHEFGLTVRGASWLRVDRRGITVRLAKGQTSELDMTDARGRSFRVSYNQEDRTPTGTCRPDNTLEIVQSDGGRRFRYLFDAKYRVRADAEYVRDYRAPGPPIDAIQRMHAYRDQIVSDECRSARGSNDASVVWDLGTRRWVQRTVGAFVLFPYVGADAHENTFFRSTSDVGVGSIPFLPGRREEVTQLVKRIAHLSAETVEDTTIGLSTEEERRRIEAAHEYGLLAIVVSDDQLNFIRTKRIYHTEYKADRQLRLRADFVVFIGSKARFGPKAAAWCWAPVRSVRFGERREIRPEPPPSLRDSKPTDLYLWFELGEIVDLPRPLGYSMRPPVFALTNRLALEQASTDVFDLLLVREPERRLAQELRAAGLNVRVYDEASPTDAPFDVGSLRLRIVVSGAEEGKTVEVRFDPRTTRFTWLGGGASWDELMFESERVTATIRSALTAS